MERHSFELIIFIDKRQLTKWEYLGGQWDRFRRLRSSTRPNKKKVLLATY